MLTTAIKHPIEESPQQDQPRPAGVASKRSTPLRVLVADESIVVRPGIARAIESAGHDVVISDPGRTDRLSQRKIDLIVTSSEELLKRYGVDGPSVVKVIPAGDIWALLEAYSHGAAAVFSLYDPTHSLVRIVDCFAAGQTPVPLDLMRELVTRYRRRACEVPLTSTQLVVLESLALGDRLSHIAEAAGYSTREISRIVSSLLETFHVTSREELLVKAAHDGVI